jgi:transcription-repair coupling factor (superfamily II helicase)
MIVDLLQSTPWPDKPGSRTAVGPCPDASAAMIVANMASHERLIVVITPSTGAAAEFERELAFFLEDSTPILTLPDWETLPYDNFSPHQDIVSERLATFHQLPKTASGVLIAPISTLMQRTPPTYYIEGSSFDLTLGQSLVVDTFVKNLTLNGYRAVETVYEHGEYAVRGALLDVFPMGSSLPYRIDLFDSDIETLRTFDPETQRTIAKVDRIRLLPAREFPMDSAAIERFKLNWYRRFDGDPDNCPAFAEISAGRVSPGAETYLPLFFDACGTLFDYLPAKTAIAMVGDHYPAAQRFWQEINNRYEEYGIDPRRPLPTPQTGYLPVEELYELFGRYSVLELKIQSDAPAHVATGWQPAPHLDQFAPDGTAIDRLSRFLDAHAGPVLLLAESTGRREILLESLQEHALSPEPVADWQEFASRMPAFAISIAPVDRPLYLGQDQPAVVTENQLFGQRVAQRRRRKTTEETHADAIVKDLTELRPGVPVVHLQHGVGRYLGLQSLTIDGDAAEFLVLEYAGDDKLYVPVSSLHLIARYTGADQDTAPLHRLGSEQWSKARRKAREKAHDVAAQLLDVYARREARAGFSCSLDSALWETFSEEFPFEETPDQTAAIQAVKSDMCADRVMDRLICGDVGFGKTEVAMRAAFIAVQNKKQVALLVPTTLLAQQHFSSFRDRFAEWPVRIEVVSRFKSAKDISDVQARVASGKVDILVGTHKLLQSDFRFEDLGLLIIDEEHRFGVKQKDAIKALRAEVDILAMTATPIPRTLNMALGGLRDLSIIATPPARRLSIKTFIREHSIALVKEAVLRETLRGGQVYYLHNEVKSIEETARKLRELLPDLSIGVAHGQLRETELERVMSDFYHQRHHILVCSTIIETGIDVPNANTILIERADKFGLAQLHQLRGRVGRSHHQAYAYLLSPPQTALTSDAQKRLEAIEAAGELGAGYQLATHDLEIRGAGELLGDEQSGQIHSVGFGLYLEMLHSAVSALRRGEIPDLDAPLDSGTEVKLHVPALIPDDYLPDIATRLVVYKRIAAANTGEGLREIQVEMIDRFGLLVDSIKNLFAQAEIRVEAQHLGIAEIDLNANGGHVEFSNKTPINPLTLVKLIQGSPNTYGLSGSSRLKISHDMPSLEDRKLFVRQLFDTLSRGTQQGVEQ